MNEEKFTLPTYDYRKYARMSSIPYKTLLEIISAYIVSCRIKNNLISDICKESCIKHKDAYYQHLKEAIDNNIVDGIIERRVDSYIPDECTGGSDYEFGEMTVHVPMINTASFVMWAIRTETPIPEEFIKFNSPSDKIQHNTTTKKCDLITDPPEETNTGGRKIETLTEVISHAYSVLLTQKNSGALISGNVRVFLKQLKEMATEGKRNSDAYILERIENVKAPDEGECSVTTRERIVNGKIIGSVTYRANAVSKRLGRLRKK